MDERPYHHGNLRAAILTAAAEVVAESGPAAVNLRELARRVGVSHAAPAHHFGDKQGVLTALAIEGFVLLVAALEAAEPPEDLVELGVAYALFAIGHPGHFAVMFRSDLLHPDDPALHAAQVRSQAPLWAASGHIAPQSTPEESLVTAVTAWSMVHGFATLWLQDALPDAMPDDPEVAVRAAARSLVAPYHTS